MASLRRGSLVLVVVGWLTWGLPGWGVAAPEGARRVDDLAAELYDDEACRKLIDTIKPRNPKGAFGLLRACVDQDKLSSLRYLLAAEWRDHLRAIPRSRQERLVAHTIASSGRFTRAERALIEEAGYRFASLEETRRDEGRVRQGLAFFRGQIKERKLRRDGKILWVVAETQPVIDRIGPTWTETGFDAHIEVVDPPMMVREGNSYFFLGRIRGADETVTTIDIIDVFPPGVDLGGLVTQ